MKKLSLKYLFMLFLLPALAQAQQNTEEIQTLGGTATITGAYGAASNRFSSIDGEFANFIGGYGGIILNRSYLLGLGGHVSVNPVYKAVDPLTRMSNRIVYFGLMNEYTLKPTRLVHISIGALAGSALWINQEHTRSSENNENWSWGITKKPKGYVVVDPSVELNVNILRNLKLAGCVSYRAILGSDPHKASGFAAQVTIKAGKFY